jgi:hypothetical protein
MFGDPNKSTSTPALLLDISLAIWTAVIITPITAPFAFLFKRSGPANMAHSVIDKAHIAAQQSRINTLAIRLHEQWILPESETIDKPQDIFVIKETWGKNDTVPDTQIFKLDFTKSARYPKRKIKIERRGSGTAWQDGAPTNAESPTPLKVPPMVPDSQIFKLDFTKSAKYHKRKIKLVRRGSGTAVQDDASATTESPAPLTSSTAILNTSHLYPTRALSFKKSATPIERTGLARGQTLILPPLKRTPTFILSAQDSTSANIGTLMTSPLEPAIDLDVYEEPSEAREAKELRMVRARTATMPTGPTSLMEEGVNYHEIARIATKGRILVGTVYLDGTVDTKRRWFCCGKRALGAAEKRAIAAAMPNQEDKIGNALENALAETIRDRVRRSHRNVCNTYNLEETFLLYLPPSVELTPLSAELTLSFS